MVSFTTYVCFSFFVSCVFVFVDRKLLNKVYQVVSGYLFVVSFYLLVVSGYLLVVSGYLLVPKLIL